ncbi:MAG: CDGSH iron-sulfur domain-containing protein [Gammaproteobacteria bacterium]|nr:CDGSH iron-sulfur domain-containing protein [Gammaproteobacteria bacterium]
MTGNSPTISPIVLDLDPGTYWWCKCGKSKKQPFCDGSHTSTEFTPERLVLTEKQTVALCLCKKTSSPPFCDGSHNK